MLSSKVFKWRRGVSLVEATVAIMVLMIVGSAIILLTLQVVSLTYSSRARNQATDYGKQMLEQIRNYYQSFGWVKLSQWGNSSGRCFVDVSTAAWSEVTPGSICNNDVLNPGCSNSSLALPGVTNFYRYVILKTQGNTSVLVSAVVTWSERGQCRITRTDTYFYSF